MAAVAFVNASVDGSAYGDAGEPSMTPDGRHVVFVGASYDGRFGISPLVDGVTFPQNVLHGHQLCVRDLQTNTTTLVSVRPNGVGSVGNDDDVNFHPSISADGSKVVFVGGIQDDFVAGDGNRQPDIFVRDLRTGTTTLVSRNAAGTSGGSKRSYAPTISADGLYVTFLSDATNLTNLPDTNNQPDLFSYSFATGRVTLLSTNTAGSAASNAGVQPRYRIDDSGLKVAFLSRSEDLMPGTGFNFFNVNFFLRDAATGTTSLISHGPASEALGTAGEIGLSRDGSTATFIGIAGFVPETTLPQGVSKQVYVYDTATGAISLASRSPSGVPVYRVYNLALGYHYYTINQAERDFLVNLVPAPITGPDTRTSGWRDEGSIGFIPSSASVGTTTVFRLYNTDSGVHLLTHNPAVRDAVLAITEGGTGRHPWEEHSNFGFAFAIAASEKLLDSGLFATHVSSVSAVTAPVVAPRPAASPSGPETRATSSPDGRAFPFATSAVNVSLVGIPSTFRNEAPTAPSVTMDAPVPPKRVAVLHRETDAWTGDFQDLDLVFADSLWD